MRCIFCVTHRRHPAARRHASLTLLPEPAATRVPSNSASVTQSEARQPRAPGRPGPQAGTETEVQACSDSEFTASALASLSLIALNHYPEFNLLVNLNFKLNLEACQSTSKLQSVGLAVTRHSESESGSPRPLPRPGPPRSP